MALTRAQKEAQLADLQQIAADSVAVTFVNFSGVSVGETTDLRQALRQAGVSYRVAKKSLVKMAFEQSDVEGAIPTLDGELAIAYTSDDPTAPAREIFAQAKTLDDKVSIMGGVFENTFQTAEEMTSIALIPSIDVLRGMFANVINSPIQGLVVALGQIAEKKEV